MRKLFALTVLTALAFTGAAAAAGGGTVSVALHPAGVSKRSHVTISASGFTETSLPTRAEIHIQKGFKTSLKSVAELCANPSACPSASQIGSGTAQVTASTIIGQVTDTVNFTLYLGRRQVAGDIASVIVTGRDARYGITASGSGRLLKDSSGGLELLVDHFPTIQNPAVSSVTLNSLSLTAGAIRTVKKHHRKVTYSLITNPSTCSGHWTGTATVTFPNAQSSNSLSIPCIK
jgi:hypothetical protein